MEELLPILGPIAAGISLAAVAGLRAFLPLFATGLAGRADWIPLADGFSWMESTPALVGFGTAVVAEVLADKLPVVDNLLDALGVLVKPCAGMASVAAVTQELDPFWKAVLAIGVGGTVAGAVHVTKAKARLGSTVATAGFGNPVMSFAEDGLALGGAVLAIALPFLALVLLLAVGWFVYRMLRAVLGRRQPVAERA